MKELTYKQITGDTLNSSEIHGELIDKIDSLRKNELEDSIPEYRIGQPTYANMHLEILKTRDNLKALATTDELLEFGMKSKLKSEFVGWGLKN